MAEELLREDDATFLVGLAGFLRSVMPESGDGVPVALVDLAARIAETRGDKPEWIRKIRAAGRIMQEVAHG